jgi:tetratricopeptide (TPR) repeat protein
MKKTGLVLFVLLSAAGSVAAQEGKLIADDQTVDLYNEALRLTESGDNEEAVTKLLGALERTPDAREIYLALVTPCFNSGQVALLQEQLKQAKTFFPDDDEFYYYSGLIYQQDNNQSMAIREFTLAIARGTKTKARLLPTYHASRGNCYLKLEQFDKAIADYTSCLALDTRAGASHANRGIAYFKTGRPALACADWKKAKGLGVSSVNQYLAKYCK